MGLVNFRVSDELKKNAFDKLTELGKTPSEVFKSVMQYIVSNGKLPFEEVAMTSLDLEEYKRQFSNSKLSSKLHEILFNSSDVRQICISADTGAGAYQAIEDMIGYYISEGFGCFVAHPAISCSETSLDRIISLTTKYNREVKLLSLKSLVDDQYLPDHYYNPLRSKSFDDIALLTMDLSLVCLSGEMQRSELYKLSLVVAPLLSMAFEGDSKKVSFTNIEKWATEAMKEDQFINDPIKLQALKLLLEGAQAVTKSPIGKFTDFTNGEDDDYFMVDQIFNQYQVGIVEIPSGFNFSDMPLLQKIMSYDLRLCNIEYSNICRKPSLCVTYADFIWDIETISSFLRQARKAVVSTIICVPELMGSKHVDHKYSMIFQVCNELIFFNTHNIKKDLGNGFSDMLFMIAKRIYSINNMQFLYSSYGPKGEIFEVIDK